MEMVVKNMSQGLAGPRTAIPLSLLIFRVRLGCDVSPSTTTLVLLRHILPLAGDIFQQLFA